MKRREKQQRGAAVVLWMLAVLSITHVTGLLWFNWFRAELRDPDYGIRVHKLSELTRQFPDRPVVIALGSSRVLNGLAADELPPGHGDGPLVFNMAFPGAGVVSQLIWLRRLVDQGIRPRAVLVEILPTVLNPMPGEERTVETIGQACWDWKELDLLPPDQRLRSLLEAAEPPWFTHRFALMRRWAPSWLPPENQRGAYFTSPRGWLAAARHNDSPEHRASRLDLTQKEYAALLGFTFISSKADAVLDMIFDLCRQHGIEVLGLIAMPESSEFRAWYKAETLELIDSYLTQKCRQREVHFVNAREWVPDDGFADGHHLLAFGARAFSARLWREVLEPWTHKQALAAAH